MQSHILFEDAGDLKTGTVRSQTETSLQVDSASGKRVKVKSAAVLLRFDRPRAEELLAQAQSAAESIDTDFLWQCAPQDEFGFEDLALEYYGRKPEAVEATAILLRLQSAPVYFQRRGRGRFRPATPEVLRAALAAVERKRRQEELRTAMVQELRQGGLPASIAALGTSLLTRPDRGSIEYKALEEAADELRMSPLRLMLARGAVASPYQWHLDSFLARAFPRGVAFPPDLPAPPSLAEPRFAGLPAAAVAAFSIDDSATTEIDDAFSVQATDARIEVGVHIAAPALAIEPGGALDAAARARMSTVYAPGLKYTMLPPAWVETFSLAEGRVLPAVSLYLDVAPETLEVRGFRTCVERIRVAANLRYDLLEGEVTAARLEIGGDGLPCGAELALLWRVAGVLRGARERARGRPEPAGREEVTLLPEGEGDAARVRLFVRHRDAPLDRIVAELMICANRCWGTWLESLDRVAIYRSQSLGRVRMSTVPAPHDGLGVERYAWCTSPLRRYVDLLNQRQLIAAAAGAAAPHRRGDADLFVAVSAFDAAYASYAEFQETMERYWSLRWLMQESVREIEGVVGRGEFVRLRGLPMSTRAMGAAGLARGQRVWLELGHPDLLELTPHARVAQLLRGEGDELGEEFADDGQDAGDARADGSDSGAAGGDAGDVPGGAPSPGQDVRTG